MTSDRNKFLTMTEDERLGVVYQIHIKTNETKRITNMLRQCHKSYHRYGEPNHLFICGETGAGKTTICRQYAAQFPMQENDMDDQVPVLYVKAPTPATIKGFASKLLAALGDPIPNKGNTETITFRLKKYLKKCCVELIIMDEFQHLTDNKTANAIKQTSNWLKLLIEEINIPVVLIGLPESDTIFSLNEQLSRRFSHRDKLKPFGWSDSTERKEFQKLLHKYDKLLPFRNIAKLSYGDMPERLYYASDGVIAYVVKLLRFAAEAAIENGENKISINNLEKIYEEQIRCNKPGKKDNPFAYDNFEYSYIKPTKKDHIDKGGMNNRIHSKEKKKSMGDIF